MKAKDFVEINWYREEENNEQISSVRIILHVGWKKKMSALSTEDELWYRFWSEGQWIFTSFSAWWWRRRFAYKTWLCSCVYLHLNRNISTLCTSQRDSSKQAELATGPPTMNEWPRNSCIDNQWFNRTRNSHAANLKLIPCQEGCLVTAICTENIIRWRKH